MNLSNIFYSDTTFYENFIIQYLYDHLYVFLTFNKICPDQILENKFWKMIPVKDILVNDALKGLIF